MSEYPATDRAALTDAQIEASTTWEAARRAWTRMPELLERFRAEPSQEAHQAIADGACDLLERQRLCAEALTEWGKLGYGTPEEQANYSEMVMSFNEFTAGSRAMLVDLLTLFQ